MNEVALVQKERDDHLLLAENDKQEALHAAANEKGVLLDRLNKTQGDLENASVEIDRVKREAFSRAEQDKVKWWWLVFAMTKKKALRRPQNSVHERKQQCCTLCTCAMDLARSAHSQFSAHDLHVSRIFCFLSFFFFSFGAFFLPSSIRVSKTAALPETRTKIHHTRLHSFISIYFLFY